MNFKILPLLILFRLCSSNEDDKNDYNFTNTSTLTSYDLHIMNATIDDIYMNPLIGSNIWITLKKMNESFFVAGFDKIISPPLILENKKEDKNFNKFIKSEDKNKTCNIFLKMTYQKQVNVNKIKEICEKENNTIFILSCLMLSLWSLLVVSVAGIIIMYPSYRDVRKRLYEINNSRMSFN